ncbi:MAG TPA: lysylphosphatidylglycerol synthase domain-containing protein [Acidimicrobiales bacterium]|nr:lysylphosphatidylglycerol synthase domain-containing protein [Acidimicrobiales bacterium]
MRRARDIVGLALAAAGVAFVVARLAGEWDDVRRALGDARPGLLMAAVALAAVALALVGALWGVILRRLGAAVQTADAVRWFFVGEIAKYVPIGIGGVVGRAEVAVRGGVPRPVAYRSVLLSLLAFYALVPALPAWIAVGGATGLVAHAVGGDVDLVRIGVATWASWAAGFVAFGAPSGIGVREAVFVELCGLPAGVGAATALLARATFMVVDLLGALVCQSRVMPRRPAQASSAMRRASTSGSKSWPFTNQ